MKNLILLIVIFSIPLFSDAQMAPIFSAIQAGDASQLEKYLDQRVEVVIEQDGRFMNKKQAVAAIDQFLKRVKVKSCREIHQGSSRSKDSKYTIGQLITTEGEFRVFLFIRESGGSPLIQEIRFDRS
jgi:hypothetical protein